MSGIMVLGIGLFVVGLSFCLSAFFSKVRAKADEGLWAGLVIAVVGLAIIAAALLS